MDAFTTYEMVKGIGVIDMDKVITAIQWLFGVIVFGLYGGIEFAQSWGDVLFNVVNIARDDLNKALTIAKERGIELAAAERKYRVEKRKAILQAKHNGEKISLIMELVNGDEVISQLRYERDVAKTLYASATEAINIYKLDCRLVEAQIARDWDKNA